MIKNIYIDQATSFTQQFQAVLGNGEIIDLTNKTLIGTMKKSQDSISEIPLTVVVTDAINGFYQIYLDSTQTASLDPSKYYLFDVIIDQDEPIKLLSGNAYISLTITSPSGSPFVPVPVQKFSISGYPITDTAEPDDYVLISKANGMFKIKVSDLLGN